MKELSANTLFEFKTRIESDDLEIVDEIYGAIKRGITKKYKSVNVFNVVLKKDPLNVYKFKLDKDQWSFALQKCLQVYSDNELFETCVEIQGLIKELELVGDIKSKE
jgi:hypothetical protein